MIALEDPTCLETFPRRWDLDANVVLSFKVWGEMLEELYYTLCCRDGSLCAVCIKWIHLDVNSTLQMR